ncbi:MAG: zinc-ribbon domain containing protein [Chloroflexi bacterium]|nr:zinc-ribbon domain containing protein [Chloroflexota bacterium]MCY3603091.1 zinc-ribbon domain containing protein [Chloroflexota bacterium]
MTSFVDRTLTCSDCGVQFTFTAGEQEFYQSRGFTNEPRRCPECRAARKAARGEGGGGGGGGGYRNYDSNREMFSAVCAECGREARVPFQPRGDRPVYCSDCFRARGPQRRGGGGGGGGGGGRDRNW